MRKVRDILRYHLAAGLSPARTADALHLSRGAVLQCLQRYGKSGLPWPLPETLTDEALEQTLYPNTPKCPGPRPKSAAAVDWQEARRELGRKGVTLRLLWEEHRQQDPGGLCYSQFCEQYRRFSKRLPPSFRNTYVGGEMSFVDYSGDSLPTVDRLTGEVTPTELFVWCWGASNLTYLEFSKSQKVEDFLGSHTRGLAYFGCVPKVIVPDNLKSAVTKAGRFEPELNYNYERFAEYHGLCILPARPYKPKDKAKVEAHVLLAQRWVVAKLRNRIFFSLAQLNQAAFELLELFNTKVMKGYGKSRRELFLEVDKPAALPLPALPYGHARWKHPVRLGVDYHFELEKNFYSAPYTLRGELLAVKISEGLVEAFHKGERVACHPRLHGNRQWSTEKTHMPEGHRQYTEWNSDRILSWAQKVGPQTHLFAQALLSRRTFPQQAYRSILGVTRLAKTCGNERVENACKRALHFQQLNYQSLERILKLKWDDKPLTAHPVPKSPLPLHENIRGEGYYATAITPHT